MTLQRTFPVRTPPREGLQSIAEGTVEEDVLQSARARGPHRVTPGVRSGFVRQEFASRFDSPDGADPTAAMATLVDIMLVFACGLMAAIVSSQGLTRQEQQQGGQDVQRAKALPGVPRGVGDVGSGFEAVGRVFRDPKTGKLILVESPGSRN